MSLHITLLGATGLIGKETLKLLLENPIVSTVQIFVRKPIQIQHQKLVQTTVENFEKLENYWNISHTDVLISAVGSTKSKTKLESDYRKIDLDIPLKGAELALKVGCRKMILVSAVGADEKSGIFYNRLKGEIENKLATLNFESLVILRPSLLIGERTESRPMERFAQIIAPLFDVFCKGKFSIYHSISAKTVAESIERNTVNSILGKHILHYKEIIKT